MFDAILTAAVLGALSGAMPGPYTTIVASTAVRRGFRSALPLALVPLLTDILPMLATALLLRRLNQDLLTAVGILGGLVLAGLGVRFLRQRASGPTSPGPGGEGGTFWATVSAGLLSPAPWIFWMVVGSPLLLRAWNRGAAQGIAFAFVLFTVLMGTAAGIAWLASRGADLMGGRRRRWVARALGVGLVVLGGVLVWQSISGNFQSLVQRQEELRDQLD